MLGMAVMIMVCLHCCSVMSATGTRVKYTDNAINW